MPRSIRFVSDRQGGPLTRPAGRPLPLERRCGSVTQLEGRSDPPPPLSASVVVVNYNGREHLDELFGSLAAQTRPAEEVILVDNASSDGSADYVRAAYPWVRVLALGENTGFAEGNNRGFALATGDVLVALNPDTVVEPTWLAELLAELEAHPEAGLATSRICLYDAPDRVNTCGNDIHLTGLVFCRGLHEAAALHAQSRRVTAASGCALAIRRSVLDEIGGFDPSFFLYFEDADLSLRANLAGYQVRLAGGSTVYHKYLLKLGPEKFFHMERNRVMVVVKNLRWGTLALLAPALVLVEAMTWTYALLHGPRFAAAKLRAYAWLFSHRAEVLRRRAAAQRLRRVDDRALLALLTPAVPVGQLIGAGPAGQALGSLAALAFRLSRSAALAAAR